MVISWKVGFDLTCDGTRSTNFGAAGGLIEQRGSKSTIRNSSGIIVWFDAFAALTFTLGVQRVKQFQRLNVHHLIHHDAYTGVARNKFQSPTFRSPSGEYQRARVGQFRRAGGTCR